MGSARLGWPGPGWQSPWWTGDHPGPTLTWPRCRAGLGAAPRHGQDRSWPGAGARSGCSPLTPQANETRSRNRSAAPDPPAQPHSRRRHRSGRQPSDGRGWIQPRWVTCRRAGRARALGWGDSVLHSPRRERLSEGAQTECDVATRRQPLCRHTRFYQPFENNRNL